MFAAAGAPFKEVRYAFEMVNGAPKRDEFNAAQAAGAFPMGQVPVLVVAKGGKEHKLCQSKAIGRYVAAQLGLLGASAEEAADIDSLVEVVNGDLMPASNAAKTPEERAKFVAEALPKHLATLEKLLGDKFAYGGKLSQADVVLYHLATHTHLPTPWGAGDPATLAAIRASPKVAAIVANVAALPGVAAWEAGRPARGEVF
jgi:glutathione S-transferase